MKSRRAGRKSPAKTVPKVVRQPLTTTESQVPFSPYRTFTRDEWAALRADTPMTLKPADLEELSGVIEELSVDEVIEIYLPLSRLLNLYVAAEQKLHSVSSQFLGRKDVRVPFVIGVAGSVAVGKSTTARVLKALLARWPDHPRVDLLTTDGFLFPNAELVRLGIMDRKANSASFWGGYSDEKNMRDARLADGRLWLSDELFRLCAGCGGHGGRG